MSLKNFLAGCLLVSVTAVATITLTTYTLSTRYQAICKDSAVFVLFERLYRCEPMRLLEGRPIA